MSLKLTQVRYIQKTQGGRVLETKLNTEFYAELESQIMRFLRNKGFDADSKVTTSGLEIKNIRNIETGVKATGQHYASLRGMVSAYLHKHNMIGKITG